MIPVLTRLFAARPHPPDRQPRPAAAARPAFPLTAEVSRDQRSLWGPTRMAPWTASITGSGTACHRSHRASAWRETAPRSMLRGGQDLRTIGHGGTDRLRPWYARRDRFDHN